MVTVPARGAFGNRKIYSVIFVSKSVQSYDPSVCWDAFAHGVIKPLWYQESLARQNFRSVRPYGSETMFRRSPYFPTRHARASRYQTISRSSPPKLAVVEKANLRDSGSTVLGRRVSTSQDTGQLIGVFISPWLGYGHENHVRPHTHGDMDLGLSSTFLDSLGDWSSQEAAFNQRQPRHHARLDGFYLAIEIVRPLS